MKNQKTNQSPLWTKDYILVFLSNLLLFGSFYMLLPILPFYLVNEMHTTQSVAGVVIALYTISALVI
ncbi:MAG: hypothetical protein LIP06_14260 [Tannerellaceae bacterium]|nr:hypothetical protein [Tannerellaceae bacterium]